MGTQLVRKLINLPLRLVLLAINIKFCSQNLQTISFKRMNSFLTSVTNLTHVFKKQLQILHLI